ncbi:MFS transporter [Rhizorhapis suberifaciens]|uniref:MFS family permease n=1 Tax=Rhizorhapis suberifaciens TaxID=13656 RepID=A0A840HYX1_9SPHN|nr:MFS transporter [Rhizorhapis suberifaciens]MBB4642851.1 MFS family permease [Rhizorhapis suberifaciens]
MHTPTDRPFSGWRVVLPCFLAQTLAAGFAFGSFGPLLASTEQHFGVTRAVAATGMSLIMLAVGGLSPLLGGLLQKVSVRSAMIGGAALSAVAYLGLALLPSFGLALVMFGLIGTGVSLLAILGPLTLISRWFISDQAKVLSIVNLPIALFVIPFIIAELLPEYGRFAVLAGIATIFLLLIPALLLIVEEPGRIGQAPRATNMDPSDVVAQRDVKDRPLSTREILTSAPFWLLSLVIGVISGSGTAFLVHIVPFGMERDLSLQAASGLLSVYAGAGILGTLLVGWLADRIGPPSTLVLATLCEALVWWGLLHVAGVPLFALAALMGMCVVPVTTMHGAALSRLVGAASISRAMGISYAIVLPFIFGFAPLIGFLFDHADGYRLPFLMTAGIVLIACLCSVLMIFAVRKQKQLFEAVAIR